MNPFKALFILIAFGFSINVTAQKAKVTADNQNDTKQEFLSYYEQRAAEDAKYEQEFKAENSNEDKVFWEEQKQYEKKLKKNNRKAYRVYIQGKKESYSQHNNYCDHDHHSDYYYRNARFYYYDYNSRSNYETRSSGATISTPVRINTPSVRLGIF
ncbi:hypothetical protein [Flavobacterium sp. LB2R40]|uniref:hypothetical protein n=1 Tax=Flavobacterium sp. LB2R40 TaxID=3401722 RepID=UPI003AAFB029